MHILSLQPYYGGSHQAFQADWLLNSEHEWTVLSLPPRHWKWRMRHAAVHFAKLIRDDFSDIRFDALFCSDFLNLAEFKGLVPPSVARLPAVVYFHENQFAYPSRRHDERDLHFGFTNFTSCLAADQVWFNSAFNRDSFFEGVRAACKKWPDFPPTDSLDSILPKCRIESPGIAVEQFFAKRRRCNKSDGRQQAESVTESKPVSIAWAARWEHDKNPQLLLDSLRELKKRDLDFRISVVGESFRRVPEAFELIQSEFDSQIDRWGFQSAEDYRCLLKQSDVFISTADHEFFGISAAEAIIAGAFPVLPNRLAYPELIGASKGKEREKLFLYDGSPSQLAEKIEYFTHLRDADKGHEYELHRRVQEELADQLNWSVRAATMDHQIQSVCDDRALRTS